MVRKFSEILIDADEAENIESLATLWSELGKNKYKYTIAEHRFSDEHFMTLITNMAKKDAGGIKQILGLC